jgi:hypothetical protein
MGSKVSTVSSYRLRQNTGDIIHCSGTCFSDNRLRHWQCVEKPPEIMHCELRCNPPAGECLPE